MKVCVAGVKSKGRKVSVLGYPELEGNIGILDKEGMAFFFGKNREFFVGNTKSGQIRKFSSPGYLLVNDRDIDLDAIAKACPNGLCNARRKDICYAGINRNIGYNQINLQLFLLFSQIRCSAFLQNALPRLITANILNRSLNFMAFATTPYALPSAIFLS